MKSIQIILLMCINIGDTFPNTMDKEVIEANLKALINKGYVYKMPADDKVISVSGYDVTPLGATIILDIYKCW